VISNGSLAGKDLHWLLENHRSELLGTAPDLGGRFPLLIKILDAQQDLSLQVHPPAHKAAALGGDPKTEMWYVVDAAPTAVFYAGLKAGQTREEFEARLGDGTVAECFHRLPVKNGDSLFLPSGRVHAIASGNVIFEIQQNSDTTYRVFDWNRVGLDGQPRELHVRQSLESINFNDFEPELAPAGFERDGGSLRRVLAEDPLFRVEIRRVEQGTPFRFEPDPMVIVAQVQGEAAISSATGTVAMEPGRFCLIPAAVRDAQLSSPSPCEFLVATAGPVGTG
jgi:mannose-6-phosphate isomerase